jgi:hypothetical protein
MPTKVPIMNIKNKTEVNNLLKQLNKRIGNKNKINKCDQFCKMDYMPYIDKKLKNTLKKYKIPSIKKGSPQSEQDKHTLKYSFCKKQFCNPECVGYPFMGNKSILKNGFSKKYKSNRVETLKNRGALSGCIFSADYNR